MLTIGHSRHPLATFLDLLRRHRVDLLIDVRSRPVSRFMPHLNLKRAEAALAPAGVRYIHLGHELGGRPDDPAVRRPDGTVDFARVAASPMYAAGIARLREFLAGGARTALVCGEEDPAGCHRRLLVGRTLAGLGYATAHIRGDGRIETEAETAARTSADKPPGGLPIRRRDGSTTRSRRTT